jgi:hypothetical protein
MYRNICNTRTRESAERLYNSMRIGNGSSQEASQVRLSNATNNKASFAMRYVGGEVVPSSLDQHSRLGEYLSTQVQQAMSNCNCVLFVKCEPEIFYFGFENTDPEMSHRMWECILLRGKSNGQPPTCRVIADLIESLDSQSTFVERNARFGLEDVGRCLSMDHELFRDL